MLAKISGVGAKANCYLSRLNRLLAVFMQKPYGIQHFRLACHHLKVMIENTLAELL